MSSLRRTALACAALVAVVGCGSTVQVQGSSRVGGGDGLTATDGGTSTGAPGSTDGSSTGAIGGTSGGFGSTSSSGSGGSTGSSSSGSSGSTSTSGTSGSGTGSTSAQAPSEGITLPPAGMTGRGFTAKTLTVGLVIISGEGSAANALGISGADSGDVQAQYDAVTKYVNKHGGIAGRQLKTVTYSVDLLTALNNPDQASAGVCAAFTQDSKVFAVLQPLPTAAQRACLSKASTPIVEGSSLFISQSEYDKYPTTLYGPGRITTDRVISLLVSSLFGRQFFTGWDTVNGKAGKAPVRLGLLHADNADANYQAALETKLLTSRGFTITDSVTYPSNVQAGLSATQSAILKFKADGVTHVLGASAFFLQGAENQHYRPRYVLPPGVGELYAANSPAAQMAGSMTVGWQPASDVNAAQDPGDVSSAETQCKAIMTGAGQSYTSRTTLASMEQVCDVELFLQDALAGQTGLSNAGLRIGAEKLGTTWRSAQTFTNRYASNQHASANAVRDQAFDAGCACVLYVNHQNRSS